MTVMHLRGLVSQFGSRDPINPSLISTSHIEPPEHPPWRHHCQHGYVHPYMLYRYSDQLLTCVKVDLGGSLAVASRGLFSTGVSTDLNGESIKR
jgi:hypothetical protein